MAFFYKKTIALVGNPNSGKTTLFNVLTGLHQHVGNYPGITVEQKEGITYTASGDPLRIIDLPGTYSLTAYTQEEFVVRMVLINNRPDAIINIVNASALERNLYLTVQLLELGIPIVIALNMIDEAQSHGMTINPEKLSAKIGIPIVETVARTGYGRELLIQKVRSQIDLYDEYRPKPLVISYGSDLDPVIASMEEKIQASGFFNQKVPIRWFALKFLEADEEVIEKVQKKHLSLSKELQQDVIKVSEHLKSTLDLRPESVITDYRYGYISSVLKGGVITHKDTTRERIQLTDKIDTILTHTFFGPLCMGIILYAIYHFTFTFGALPMEWVAWFFVFLRNIVEQLLPTGFLKSLIISGIIDGAGGVMSFIPLILLIFLQIAILEDSGYMARMAYMLDRIFRFFGLHGCSVMPFVIGGGIAGGCAVPGVLAARTLRSPREKLATLLVIPFMSCGAKLPVFILFAGIFFPGHEAGVMFGLTLTGWCVALITAKILRLTIIRGPSTPFVMELPPYRLPLLRGILIHTYERTWSYLKKAGTTILLISIVLWAAMTYPELPERIASPYNLRKEELKAEIVKLQRINISSILQEEELEKVQAEYGMLSLRNSFAGRLGLALEPITKMAGFNWQTDIALLGGFVAKEVIIATLGTAYSLGQVDTETPTTLAEEIKKDTAWTPASALALLVFVLLYAPCLVTLITIWQETGSWGWPIFSLVFNTVLAFIIAVFVRHVFIFL